MTEALTEMHTTLVIGFFLQIMGSGVFGVERKFWTGSNIVVFYAQPVFENIPHSPALLSVYF